MDERFCQKCKKTNIQYVDEGEDYIGFSCVDCGTYFEVLKEKTIDKRTMLFQSTKNTKGLFNDDKHIKAVPSEISFTMNENSNEISILFDGKKAGSITLHNISDKKSRLFLLLLASPGMYSFMNEIGKGKGDIEAIRIKALNFLHFINGD